MDDVEVLRLEEITPSVPSGCSLLFYETYGKSGSAEQELSPRYALLADDSIVQAVPEHPKKEHVFCLSNSYGDVYLFQVRRPLTHSCNTQKKLLFLLFLSLFFSTLC